jgi:hypothetical protein
MASQKSAFKNGIIAIQSKKLPDADVPVLVKGKNRNKYISLK